MLSFVCTRTGEQDDLLLPAWATSSFTTVAGQAGWRGVKPSLDALIDVAAAGCVIKADASQRPMRIVRSCRSYRAGRRDWRAVSAGLFLRARARHAALLAAMRLPASGAKEQI